MRPAEKTARPLHQSTGVTALDQVQARAQRLRSVDQWQALQAELEATPGVRAVSPVAAGPGLVTRGDANKSVTITGIVPARYVAVTRLDEKIVAGGLPLNPGEVAIGTDLARDLGVAIGDRVRLSTPTSPGGAYQVRGIYDLGQRGLNRAYAYLLTAVMSNFVRADDGTPLFTAHIDATLYGYTVLGAIVLGPIAAVMPARRAAKLDPAQAIRL